MNPSPAPKPALLPTALPLPPQDIHPDELKVILAEAAARHAEAEEALAVAQDHFDAAERQREYALSEEQKRLEREEQARIEKLRELYSVIVDDAAEFQRRFSAACAEQVIDFDHAVELFVEWARYRTLAGRLKDTVLRYDSQQSGEAYEAWTRRIAGWTELIRSVTSRRNGGVLDGAGDDLDGLAAVNLRINQDSQDAPRPLNRDATDQSTPFLEDLGLRNPALASMDQLGGALPALDFNIEFSNAIAANAEAWSRRTMNSISEKARADFAESANTGTGEN